MNPILYLANFGGVLSILIFIHFFVDWIFQSHAEAMVKHNNALVRVKHCLIYTIGFDPLLIYLMFIPHGLAAWEYVLSLVILFISHYIEDSYIPVFLWAKYIRKPPEMDADPKAGFMKFVSTPLGKILMIAIDQIIHITFLLPVAWLIMRHIR